MGFMHASFDLVKYLVVILNDLLQFIFQLMMDQIVQQLFDFLYECAKSSFVFCGTRLFLFQFLLQLLDELLIGEEALADLVNTKLFHI